MNPDTPASKPEPPSLDTTEKACVIKAEGWPVGTEEGNADREWAVELFQAGCPSTPPQQVNRGQGTVE